ncbi:MAG: trypsin-like peptidase domain-containing protein [Planctomycetota bacterium]
MAAAAPVALAAFLLPASAGCQQEAPDQVRAALVEACQGRSTAANVVVFPIQLMETDGPYLRFGRAGDKVADWVAKGLRSAKVDGGAPRVMVGGRLAASLRKANRPPEAYDPEFALDHAALVGATHAVVGELYWESRRLRLELRLFDVVDGEGVEIGQYDQDLGGPAAWPGRFGGKLVTAMESGSRTPWAAGGVDPDPDVELQAIGEAVGARIRDAAGAAWSRGRVVLVAADQQGQTSQLTGDVLTAVRAVLADAGVETVASDGLARSLQADRNRSLWHWGSAMLSGDRQAVAAGLGEAGLQHALWLQVRDRGNGTFSLSATRVDADGRTSTIPCGTFGRVPALGALMARRHAAQRAPLSTFEADPRSELFLAVDQAARKLADANRSRLQPGDALGLGGLRLGSQRKFDDLLDSFREQVDRWRADLEREHASAEPVERRRLVLDSEAKLQFGDRLYRSLRQAEGALAQMEHARLAITASTSDLEDLRSRLRDSLAAAGLPFAGGDEEIEKVLAQHRAMQDVAMLLREPMPLPSVSGPRFMIDARVRDEGKGRGVVVTACLLDMHTGRPTPPVEVATLPACRDGILKIVGDIAASQLAVEVPKPDPRLLVDVEEAKVAPEPVLASGEQTETEAETEQPASDETEQAPPKPRPVRNLERFLEARVGNVVMQFQRGERDFVHHRAGTCFAIRLPDGRGVLVTNRHVVTGRDEKTGKIVLATETQTFGFPKSIWVHFPTADGGTENFEARVLGWSPRCDLAVLEDRRRDPVFFEMAPADSVQLGDPLLVAGYPGKSHEARGLQDVVVVRDDNGTPRIGADGRAVTKASDLIFSGGAGDVKGLVDIFVTRGAFNSFGRPKRGEFLGRSAAFDASAFHGNSGGPVMTRDLKVFVVLNSGRFTAEVGESNPLNLGLVLEDHLEELVRLAGQEGK